MSPDIEAIKQHRRTLLLQRRRLLGALGTATVAVGLLPLAGCGSSEELLQDSNDDTSTGGSDTSPDTGTIDNGEWASGGTAAITDSFPDDSIFTAAATCALALTPAQTEGPCYFQGEYLDDISEEQKGLPMMLCLQLVNSNCEPLSGYEIEVWHTNNTGLYSGDSSDSADAARFNTGYCTGNDSAALASRWFRGIQVTDASGRVNFYSCFPGWYASRAIHIHFRVRNNNNDEVVSQFGFDDEFSQTICTSHSDYVGRGQPDTYNSSDNIFDGGSGDYLFNLQANSDGSLLAYKRIQIE